MVVRLTKEDVTPKTITSTLQNTNKTVNSATDSIKAIQGIISTPAVQGIITGLAQKYGAIPPPSNGQQNLKQVPIPAPPVVSAGNAPVTSVSPPTTEKIFNALVNSIDGLVAVVGDIPLSQAKQQMLDNRVLVMGMIQNELESA